jgi:hypothetical protein
VDTFRPRGAFGNIGNPIQVSRNAEYDEAIRAEAQRGNRHLAAQDCPPRAEVTVHIGEGQAAGVAKVDSAAVQDGFELYLHGSS